MNNSALNTSSIIRYSTDAHSVQSAEQITSLQFYRIDGHKRWLNTYSISENFPTNEIISNNNFDDFLLELLSEPEHSNKVIELTDMIFISLNILNIEDLELSDKHITFVVASDFLWSLQERQDQHFEWIRQRIKNNKGLVRKKNIDYLLFLLISSIIDNYEDILDTLSRKSDELFDTPTIDVTPAFTAHAEEQKRLLLSFKRAAINLRNTLVKLSTVESMRLEEKYFIELKEQANNLISEADFEILEVDSKINLIFSIQNHKLNEIMKILTVISVIFMPLTFITGLYGMNFEYMPELHWKHAYGILLLLMLGLSVCSIIFFRRKKWL